MHLTYLRTAAIFGIVSVALGAFAAHGLRDIISERAMVTFETAVRYQFYHAFALLATGIIFRDFSNDRILWAGRLFILGIILFSGSLYALALTGYTFLGIITPFGGLCFIAGWLMLAVGLRKSS
jgi:hypothetical protein